MSVHVSSWVWKHSKSTGSEKLLLLAMADMANAEGVCWPSTSSLTEMCGWKDQTSVQRHLAKLIERGEIKAIPKFRKDGSRCSNEYQFTAFQEDRKDAGGGPQGCGEGTAQQRLALYKTEPSVNHHIARPENQEEVSSYCLAQNLTENDGVWVFNHWMGNGFVNGKNPIKDWKRTIVAWKAAHIFPSQRDGNGNTVTHVLKKENYRWQDDPKHRCT